MKIKVYDIEYDSENQDLPKELFFEVENWGGYCHPSLAIHELIGNETQSLALDFEVEMLDEDSDQICIKGQYFCS
jgi:hypothetical protein